MSHRRWTKLTVKSKIWWKSHLVFMFTVSEAGENCVTCVCLKKKLMRNVDHFQQESNQLMLSLVFSKIKLNFFFIFQTEAWQKMFENHLYLMTHFIRALLETPCCLTKAQSCQIVWFCTQLGYFLPNCAEVVINWATSSTFCIISSNKKWSYNQMNQPHLIWFHLIKAIDWFW